MEASQPIASVRSRTGSSVALAIVVGVLALPAAAAAGPVEDVTQRAAQATEPVGQVVDRTRQAVPSVRETAEQSAARLEPTVKSVTGQQPIRSTVQAVTASVDRAAPQTGPALAEVTGRPESSVPTASTPSQPTVGRREVGGIDRQASRQSGRAKNRPSEPDTASNVALLPIPQAALETISSVEQARSDASSTFSSGDDGGFDTGQPPFGFDGGGNALGGPAGIALMALLGLLAAILALIPRFSTRLLHMSPARWGLVAFLVPIERPG